MGHGGVPWGGEVEPMGGVIGRGWLVMGSGPADWGCQLQEVQEEHQHCLQIEQSCWCSSIWTNSLRRKSTLDFKDSGGCQLPASVLPHLFWTAGRVEEIDR